MTRIQRQALKSRQEHNTCVHMTTLTRETACSEIKHFGTELKVSISYFIGIDPDSFFRTRVRVYLTEQEAIQAFNRILEWGASFAPERKVS